MLIKLLNKFISKDIAECIEEPRHIAMQELLNINNAMQRARLYRLDDNGLLGIVPDCNWVGRARSKLRE